MSFNKVGVLLLHTSDKRSQPELVVNCRAVARLADFDEAVHGKYESREADGRN